MIETIVISMDWVGERITIPSFIDNQEYPEPMRKMPASITRNPLFAVILALVFSEVKNENIILGFMPKGRPLTLEEVMGFDEMRGQVAENKLSPALFVCDDGVDLSVNPIGKRTRQYASGFVHTHLPVGRDGDRLSQTRSTGVLKFPHLRYQPIDLDLVKRKVTFVLSYNFSHITRIVP